jgi:hypothetical protein
VTIKLYSFVSSKGTDDVMKIYDTKRRCGWEGGLSVVELQLQSRKDTEGVDVMTRDTRRVGGEDIPTNET